jgi:hypothetical protein
MAATNIGSSKYPLAKIPAMADPADIQVALKYYHWGQEAEPEGTATAGISKYLDDIDTRIDAIDATLTNAVEETVIDAKGDLLVGTSNNNLDNLTVGSDGHILTADSTQGTFGLKWAAPTAASVSTPGVVQLSDSTSETSSVKAATPTAVKAVQDTKSALDFTILEKTANHALVLSDAYKIIEMNLTSTANTVTIPLNATQAFAIGSQITIIQTGTGATTVVVTAGVTLNCTPQVSSNAAKLRTQYSSCTLIKRATNTWIAIGDLSA